MAARWIWAMSVLPLVAVIIACIGLLNLLLASLRARRRELGILRAVGFTRGTLARLIVAENLLVGVVAVVLGVVFGIVGGWCGTGVASRLSFFGGMRPVLTIPVGAILIGGLLMLAFTALTALGPAMRLCRKRPLELLREGAVTF